KNNGACSDGLFCDGTEVCTATGCASGPAPNCNDNVPCTTDVCDELHLSCVHTPSNASCSDGKFCDGVEVCDLTLGCKAGPAPNCNDHVACTTDACSEATKACTHAPSNALCSDGQFCDGVETCSPTTGCQPGTPPNCNDGVVCTADACDETHDTCAHTPSNASCSDGQFCDGTETCSPSKGCQPGTPPNCNDGVVCTVDLCDEAHDRCTNTENDSLCSDNMFCDGIESCNALTGCKEGTPPNCADNVDCTQDFCDETTHSCGHLEHDERCSDGLFCNGAERCDDMFGCLFGVPPICSDNFTCTTDTCSEDMDKCVHVGDTTACGDGVVQTACGEECDPGDHEICDNFIDDDGDGKIDCADEDCEQGVATCDVDCVLRQSCVVLSRDPAIISFPMGNRAVDA